MDMPTKFIRLDRPFFHQTLVFTLKVVVLVVFGLFLYQSFRHQENLTQLWATFVSQIRPDRSIYLLIALSLVIVNWWLEALKWQRLVRLVLKISVREAFRAVLVGISVSIFTPHRIGEYLGRIILVPPGSRTEAVVALSFGSFIQMILIGALGLFGLTYLASTPYPLPLVHSYRTVWLVAILVIFLLLMYFGSSQIVVFCRRHFGKYLPKFWYYLDFISRFKLPDLFLVFNITLIRIGVYVIQYYLLLLFFDIEVPADMAIATILVGYLIQTGLPLPTLFALLARGEITLILWKFYGVNELSILAASYGLWVINLVMPALVGIIHVMKIKFKSSY